MINDLGNLPTADRVAQLDLGELQKDETQSFLFELVLPSRKPGTYRLGKTEVMYDIPERGERDKVVSEEILINYTDDQTAASVVTPQVMAVVDSVSVFRQQTRALEFAASGERGKATQLLRSAATQLLSQGQQELAEQALAEAGRIEQGGGASAAGTKKLQYGTRKLTQLLEPIDLSTLTGSGQE
jgi:Ca-activated chloride channel family protein